MFSSITLLKQKHNHLHINHITQTETQPSPYQSHYSNRNTTMFSSITLLKQNHNHLHLRFQKNQNTKKFWDRVIFVTDMFLQRWKESFTSNTLPNHGEKDSRPYRLRDRWSADQDGERTTFVFHTNHPLFYTNTRSPTKTQTCSVVILSDQPTAPLFFDIRQIQVL
jgi:hypothetical protein